MSRFAYKKLVIALAFALGACGADSTGPVQGGGGGDGGGVKADPSFANDVFPVFTRYGCTAGGCHGTGQGELTMTSATTAYGNLVGVPSSETGELRVIAGNAEDSYLVQKLEGRATVGARMPFGGQQLTATDLQNIKNWINQGARNN
jgi:hypothetical protein